MSEGKLRRNRVLERTLSFESLEERRVMASLPFGATAEDTGEFMLGRIAVTPVLLESDGTIDPSTENWTPSHVAAVMNNIQTGLNWWTQLLQKESSVHTLEWVIDRSYADNRPGTPYEPINRTS
ncbi:MAG: protein containing Planctomycete extracellular domain protein, partial [Planctomycetes bacterium]|nr:protein containing Planctomycete extracellular domain protein [Planctomycetota bacterium]